MGDLSIERSALYDLVWSEPISKLADRYGYSDVGFSKLCRKLGIPLPSRGHWARIKAGQKIRQPPLPPVMKGQQEKLQLPALSEQEQQSRAAKRDQQTAARQSISPERVAAEATRLHPLAKAAQKRLKQADSWTEYKGLRSASKEVLDIEVTKDSVDRAALIASAVLHELQRVGTSIQIDGDKSRTLLQLRNTQIGLKISEHVARTPHETTPAEKHALERYRSSSGWGAGNIEYPRIPQYDFTPTGLLTITASGYPERNWRDTKRTPLENRIGEVTAGIISLAEEVRDREIESARRHAEHARKVEHYKAEVARRAEERRAYRALRADAKKWVAATELRHYLRAVESAAIQSGVKTEELATWLEWAARKADWLDPTILVSDAILDAPEPEKPGYSYW